jgi:hypothetical protein
VTNDAALLFAFCLPFPCPYGTIRHPLFSKSVIERFYMDQIEDALSLFKEGYS